ncbi:hypothetical protein CSOJ01_12442 [Colletotrichum sojae]|uniref:Uncharacterized protein n=1 Tax=Colletotrichum sojae TaxID=2175907 RepID=A0A8H6MMC1_9PEZI|nr:hypothetical protein CSOJ01_12442 [Colletotrichum sojae]
MGAPRNSSSDDDVQDFDSRLPGLINSFVEQITKENVARQPDASSSQPDASSSQPDASSSQPSAVHLFYITKAPLSKD